MTNIFCIGVALNSTHLLTSLINFWKQHGRNFSYEITCSVAKHGAESTVIHWQNILQCWHICIPGTPKYQTVSQWWKMERNAKTSMRAIRCFVLLGFKLRIAEIKENIPVHVVVSASCFRDVGKYDCKRAVLTSAFYFRSKYPQTTALQLYLPCMFDYCRAGVVLQWVMGHHALKSMSKLNKWK